MPPHDPEDDHLLSTGYRLEEFEIVRVLGEGGFGIAYLAFDHTLRQQRVIKEFLPDQDGTAWLGTETTAVIEPSRSDGKRRTASGYTT
mgnify:CR=1 FL=1